MQNVFIVLLLYYYCSQHVDKAATIKPTMLYDTAPSTEENSSKRKLGRQPEMKLRYTDNVLHVLSFCNNFKRVLICAFRGTA